ncbi:PREDICTED: protein YLS3-like [Camelina sativa]|uniref:Protein YLS3-like n=1 Tax=Camelina sativa TaxID=90675 RepID=A0ABM0YRG1_CAMSA|nr:PREDICTED: protein YLS3-like [Camelina sativa]
MARFMGYNQNPQMLALCITVAVMFLGVRSDLNQDIKGCQDAMSDLYSCLPYVSNKAKAPDSTCCSKLKVNIDKGQTKRCLCTLVKDRDDPGLGFKVDANRAMSLPSACHVPANISKCPELLHLPLNSPASQIFKQFTESSQNAGHKAVSKSSSSIKGRAKKQFGIVMAIALSILCNLSY